MRGPAGTLQLPRLGARKRKCVSEPGQERETQLSAHLGCPDSGSPLPSGAPGLRSGHAPRPAL